VRLPQALPVLLPLILLVFSEPVLDLAVDKGSSNRGEV
jgi:hypothetical protein